jgi:DNA-binding GntR family transcriptional regulator
MQAYDILKEAIIRGVLTDDEMVTERRAQEQFGISRTPFREAMQSLEAEGWVYSVPYKGSYVRPITLKDINDIFDLRLILESGIVEFAQGRLDQVTLQKLESLVRSMRVSPDEQDDHQFMALDRDFHQMIYSLADNRRITAISDQISDLIRRIGMRSLHNPSRREEVIAEHQRIVTGLRNGQAVEAVRYHIEKTREGFTQV